MKNNFLTGLRRVMKGALAGCALAVSSVMMYKGASDVTYVMMAYRDMTFIVWCLSIVVLLEVME